MLGNVPVVRDGGFSVGFGAVKGGSDARKGQPRRGDASAAPDPAVAFSIPPGLTWMGLGTKTPASPGTGAQVTQPRAGPGLKHTSHPSASQGRSLQAPAASPARPERAQHHRTGSPRATAQHHGPPQQQERAGSQHLLLPPPVPQVRLLLVFPPPFPGRVSSPAPPGRACHEGDVGEQRIPKSLLLTFTLQHVAPKAPAKRSQASTQSPNISGFKSNRY